jgi:hypothetical protein
MLKTKIKIALILCLILTGNIVASASTYTPDRPDNAFNSENESGYTYPTFNNFQYDAANPWNKAGSQRNNDERQFLLAKYCDGGTCDDNAYYDTVNLQNAQVGEQVEFEIYFHNNASDPYDDYPQTSSPDASNVKVGIDLNDPEHPVGFIYSPDNRYKENNGSTIAYEPGDFIYENGNVGDTARTASDMSTFLNLPDNLTLELREDWSVLYMAYGTKSAAEEAADIDDLSTDGLHTFYYNLVPTADTNINVHNASPAQSIGTHVTTDQESNQEYVWFSKLPGCFRYGGYIQFRAYIVEKPEEPNVCEDLSLASTRELSADEVATVTAGASTGPLYELSLDTLDFNNGTIPAGTKIKWEALDDPSPTFWVPFLGSYLAVSDTEFETLAVLPAGDNSIIFEGTGRVAVEVETVDPDLDSRLCEDETIIVEEEQVCEELQVNYQDPIYEDRLSTFNAKSIDPDGDVFKGKITYSVDAGHGKFYLNKPPLTENSSPTITEFDANGAIAVPGGGWCGPDNTNESDTRTGFPGVDLGTVWDNSIDYEIDFTDVIGTTEFDISATFDNADTDDDDDDNNTPAIPGTALPDFTIGEIIDISSTVAINQDNLFEKYDPKEFYQVPEWVKTGLIPKAPASYVNPDEVKISVLDLLEAEAAGFEPAGAFAFEIDPNFTANYQPLADIIANPYALDLSIEPLFDGVLFPSYSTITVDPGTEVYFWGDDPGEDVIHVTTACTDEEECERDFDVTPLPRSCEAITVECDPENAGVGEDVTCEITSTVDSEGDVLPDTTQFLWTTDTDCTFSDPNNIGGATNHLNTLIDQPITCTNPLQEGTIFVTIDESDELYSSTCSTPITISSDLVCEDLSLYLRQFGEADLEANLAARLIYSVSAEADYSQPNVNTVTLAIDAGVGRFLTDITADQFISLVSLVPPIGDLELSDLENIFDATQIHTSVEVAELELATLVTFSDPTNSAQALTAVATGYEDTTECFDSIGFEEDQLCEYLEIEEDDDCFSVTGDFENHDGEVEVCVSDGEIAKEGTEDFSECLTFSEDEVASSGNELNFECNDTEDATISAEAVGSDNPECSDSITPEVDDNPPEIEKFVYPENAIRDADDNLINIAEAAVTPYVTYMLVVNIGDDITDIDIWDESISASGKIGSSGSLSGFLNFEELAVFVVDGNDEKSVYTSSGYHEDALSPSGKYSDFHDDNLNLDDDLDDLKDDFDCDEGNNDENFCLDDYDDAEKNFGKGSKLRFKNVDQLDDDSFIIIKYEMANVSVINQSTCQNLPADSGCGEAFLNIGRYESEDDEYDDADDAEVIVVCPYILTREGGDVFFHDVIDTGAEAAYCSEFKGGDGPGITPVPVPEQTTPSTGSGDLPDGTLSLDTHDICKYSNLDTGIEGYDNVLKNFSSTICELQATVAEEWTEQYINDAITANLTKVARWGETLFTKSFSTMASITSNNDQSGVFVSLTSDINIDEEFIIGPYEEIPAGQTYIVQGHDLNINANIVYAESDFTNPNAIPSAAFIVIDGNINIAPNVTEINGVFMAINTDSDMDYGQVVAAAGTDGNKKTSAQLTIHGNLVGNVYDLFTNRVHVGNASQDEGSVVIHYDERILLNTPPGISELVSVEYALVPN